MNNTLLKIGSGFLAFVLTVGIMDYYFPAQKAFANTLASETVAYWSFDNASISGSTVNDLTANANNGSLFNSPTTGGAGVIGQDLALNGSNQDVEIAGNNITSSVVGANAITVSGWVKAGGSSFAQDTVILTDVYNGNIAFAIAGNLDGGATGATNIGAGFYNGAWHTVGAPLTFGQWEFVAATYDGSTITLYINGVSVGTLNVSATIPSGSASWRIGQKWDSGDFFDGNVDEMAIFDAALSPTDIATLYNSGAGLQYPFVSGGGSGGLPPPAQVSFFGGFIRIVGGRIYFF